MKTTTIVKYRSKSGETVRLEYDDPAIAQAKAAILIMHGHAVSIRTVRKAKQPA